jgi:hypothetical protein
MMTLLFAIIGRLHFLRFHFSNGAYCFWLALFLFTWREYFY